MTDREVAKTQTFTSGSMWVAYTAYTIVSTLVSLPAYLVAFAVPSLRPNSNWSFYTCVANHATRLILEYVAVTELPTPQITSVPPRAGTFVLLDPALDETLYAGAARDDAITPAPAGAVWVPDAPHLPLRPGQFLTLHLHGGAYVALSPGSRATQTGPRRLAAATGAPVLMLDYRLACKPAHAGRFPAALQDAVTAYAHVLSLGVPPARILLSGDSAGAHLSLALLRHIHALHHPALPPPAGAALWSPWLDVRDGGAPTPADYLPAALTAWGARALVPTGADAGGPFFAPGRHAFRVGARLFVHAGAREALARQIRDGVEAFAAVEGNELLFRESADAPHDLFAAGCDLGFAAEVDEVIGEAVAWLTA